MEILNEMKCPLCHEVVYSEIGKGCLMCGMPLEDKSRDFCSKSCREKHRKIKSRQETKIKLLNA